MADPYPHNKRAPLINARRRNALKLFAFGGGAFLLGKILGPSINLFGGWGGKEYDFDNFRVVESGRGLGFYDKLGNEILLMEKDAHADD